MVQATENTQGGGDKGGFCMSPYMSIPLRDSAADTAPTNNGINNAKINVPTLILLIIILLSEENSYCMCCTLIIRI